MIQQRSLCLPLLVVAALLVARPGTAASSKPDSPPIQIEVISVTASNDANVGTDPKLLNTPWTRILRSLFAYESYQMNSRSTQRTVCRRMLTFSLPGGIILHVAPMKIDGQRIDILIDMFDAERPRMMNMRAMLENNATLVLGGPHYPPGMMIVLLNVGIVGSLPPAPPRPNMPQAKAPAPQASPGPNMAPEMQPGPPSDTSAIAPISTQP
jgi:hypothetical protein